MLTDELQPREAELAHAVSMIANTTPLPIAMARLIAILEGRIHGARSILLALRDGAFEPIATSLDDELSNSICGQAFALARLLFDTGAADDEAAICDLTQQRWTAGRLPHSFTLAVERGFTECISAQLLSTADELLGVLIVFRRGNNTTVLRANLLLRPIAEIAGVAIQNQSCASDTSCPALHTIRYGRRRETSCGYSRKTDAPTAYTSFYNSTRFKCGSIDPITF
jgi:hypothetical protein